MRGTWQVKLGFDDLVAKITSQCVRQDRPDAVAKVRMRQTGQPRQVPTDVMICSREASWKQRVTNGSEHALSGLLRKYRILSMLLLTVVHLLQVSIEMMLAGELLAVSKITNKMVENGDISDAAYICRAMADHGHQVQQQQQRKRL